MSLAQAVSMKDVANQAKLSVTVAMQLMPKAVNMVGAGVDAASSIINTAANAAQALEWDSNRVHTFRAIVKELSDDRKLIAASIVQQLIPVVEKSVDGEKLSPEDFDLLEAAEDLLDAYKAKADMKPCIAQIRALLFEDTAEPSLAEKQAKISEFADLMQAELAKRGLTD